MQINGGEFVRKSSWLALGLIVVIAVGLVITHRATRQPLSTEDEIRLFLARVEAAIERKDLQAALSCVDRDYSDPAGYTYESLRLQGVQALRAEGRYDVSMEEMLINVQNDQSLVQAEVSIALISNDTIHHVFTAPVKFHLNKKSERQWLVVPVKRWKIHQIDGIQGRLTEE